MKNICSSGYETKSRSLHTVGSNASYKAIFSIDACFAVYTFRQVVYKHAFTYTGTF